MCRNGSKNVSSMKSSRNMRQHQAPASYLMNGFYAFILRSQRNQAIVGRHKVTPLRLDDYGTPACSDLWVNHCYVNGAVGKEWGGASEHVGANADIKLV
jgi:hypothetical protein